ncbi:Dsc2p ASCRUDRAFT_34391 [Ascoidea rubescens DSM 1968]|uniref:Derlin n=1 Tax=Ascoidea rubescens DSM 1968 TaxID=1344418 RepID=A0A1D2VIZ7_9ASCO|nr:hypothetical protein ASCRUDRAFT_34391 [Ascoidea rubescens DSM 1968]ODV61601.1 hypothetical protein ASCRUDRAFT_34391 [Ascoidea rubescens DSM 1968]
MAPPISIVKGFKNTSVTKYLLLINIIFPILISITNYKYFFIIRFNPFLKIYKQYLQKLIFHQFFFLNESQVLVSSILFYNFKNLEKFLSSYTYLKLILLVLIYNFFTATNNNYLHVVLNFLNCLINDLASGPFSVLFGLLYLYNELIPTIYKFEIQLSTKNKSTKESPNTTTNPTSNGFTDDNDRYKFVLNDKIFVYVLAIQLALSEGFKSLKPSFMGWLLCSLVFNDIFPGKNCSFSLLHRLFQKGPKKCLPPATSPAATNDSSTDLDPNDEPVRPLGTQFLDAFRR